MPDRKTQSSFVWSLGASRIMITLPSFFDQAVWSASKISISSAPLGTSSWKIVWASNGAVVVAHAGVVAADDQVRAAAVLAEHRVQHGLARAGVEHVEAVAGDQHGVRREVELDHLADGSVAHVGGDVALLELAEQHVDQDAVGLDASWAMRQSSSWARCIGLRVWKATTLFQPSFCISSRIW